MAGALFGVVAQAAGEAFTLLASAARTATAGVNGAAVAGFGRFRRFVLMLDVTAAATDAGDTLDVYVDGSLDGATWFNLTHFTQVLGNGGAKKFAAVLDPSAPGTSVFDVSSDANAGAVRPAVFAPYLRARYVLVDADGDGGFTFGVTGYGQS
jgi:hypothetical protein